LMGPTASLQTAHRIDINSQGSFEIDIDDALIQEDVEEDVFAATAATDEERE